MSPLENDDGKSICEERKKMMRGTLLTVKKKIMWSPLGEAESFYRNGINHVIVIQTWISGGGGKYWKGTAEDRERRDSDRVTRKKTGILSKRVNTDTRESSSTVNIDRALMYNWTTTTTTTVLPL